MTDSRTRQWDEYERVDGVAVVTGGASGIGLSMARAYAARGARVLIADVDQAALDRACVDLLRSGSEVRAMTVDVTALDAVTSLSHVAGEMGPIAAVCLNAGVMASGSPAWEIKPELVDFVMSVNLRSLFGCVAAFVPRLIAQSRPAELIITASMAGLTAVPFSAAYAASKAGAIALAKSLRIELEQTAPSVRLALLNPGMVATNLIRTSAVRGPLGNGPDPTTDGMHEALNAAGVNPDDAVGWAFDALRDGTFWALPPARDPFVGVLTAELDQLKAALQS